MLHRQDIGWRIQHSLDGPHKAARDMVLRLKWTTFPTSSFQDFGQISAVTSKRPRTTDKHAPAARGEENSFRFEPRECLLELFNTDSNSISASCSGKSKAVHFAFGSMCGTRKVHLGKPNHLKIRVGFQRVFRFGLKVQTCWPLSPRTADSSPLMYLIMTPK